MTKHILSRVLLAAVLAGCSQQSVAQAWNVSDLQGSWSLTLRTDPTRGARIRITPEDGQTAPRSQTTQSFVLDVAVRDGRIAGCNLNPGAGDVRCTVRNGVFVVETADPSGPSLTFTLERRSAAVFEGEAAMKMPFFGRQAVGTAAMTRAR